MSFNDKISFIYKIDGLALQKVSHTKDFGVHYNNEHNFSHHTKTVRGQAQEMLGFIKRLSRHFFNPSTLIVLYSDLVKPKMEFASVVLNPQTLNNISLLETVYIIKSIIPFLIIALSEQYTSDKNSSCQVLPAEGKKTLAYFAMNN
ncbi:hypothetical protein JTB14_015432 [Gonioctena quinquepunctata]|nr:hypothetical protein JTB14_015432 [Gonioctena quinquepunctata]